VVLAVPAALIGFANLPFDFAHPFGFAAWTMFSLEYFESHPAEFDLVLALGSTLLAVGGILAATAIYRRRDAVANDPMLRMGLVTQVLEHKYYLDHLYMGVIVRPLRDKVARAAYWFNDHVLDRIVYLSGAGALALGRATYRTVDQRLIDGAVNGVGNTANYTGGLLKFAQSGNVQLYAGAMFVGVFVLGVLFALA
jgi:NADH-quinone oxidoreductase subunit L